MRGNRIVGTVARMSLSTASLHGQQATGGSSKGQRGNWTLTVVAMNYKRGKERHRKDGNRKKAPTASAAAARRGPLGTATEAWLNAIHDATEVVTPVDGSFSSVKQEDIVASLSYLDVLASILEQFSHEWDTVPMGVPPPFREEEQQQARDPQDSMFQGDYRDEPPANIAVPTWNASSENRFATFQYDSDESTSSSSSSDDDNDDDDLPTPTAVTPSTSTTTAAHTHLSMRRIMIRIVTAQSEVLACQASYAPPEWLQGADLYQASLFKIHHALSLADSECAKWLEAGEIPASLQQDANVVEVAIQYLTKQTDKFRARAQKKERQLMQRLEPQWQTRDEIKKKWGSERWNNNPRPKRNHAAMRAADEEQLRQIRAALKSLEEMDTQGAVQSSRALKDQVMASGKQKKERKRDNGQRPTDLSKRLSLSEYPDATEFGWVFTGSSDNAVEFFERDGVKLDWYFTTGTIKTSLDHPKRGKTQLFGARVTPSTYVEILLNPRAHTNKRYRNKNERKPSRDLWVPGN